MDSPISRAEHEEFKARLQEENERQNKRLEILEENTKQIGSLTVSVEKLAQSIELMVKEQESQGKRLQTLENRDGEKWRSVIAYLITAIVGGVIGFIIRQLGGML
jgi:TolA-binding protein|nr:MAG TPA_asm: hemolysin XhlA [Caudoviricetes sp.]